MRATAPKIATRYLIRQSQLAHSTLTLGNSNGGVPTEALPWCHIVTR